MASSPVDQGRCVMARLSANSPHIHPDCEIVDSHFGRFTEIGAGSRILNSQFGDYSYCDRFADIANAEIGKFANIASYVRIGPTDHPMQLASLHHFTYRSASYWDDAVDDDAFFMHRKSRVATVGHDCWIGHGAVIRPEIRIGTGAVIGAGAIVTHDVPDYWIVTGVPAKPMRSRFTESIIDRLLALAWWDWPHNSLRAALTDFKTLTVEDFLDKYED